jgi:hypothetical protein
MSNPADAEVCSSCQAQLKPISFSPSEADNSDSGLDWLRDISGFNGEHKKPKDEEDTPDWLSRIRERDRVEEQLASMKPGSKKPEKAEPAQPANEEENWLADFIGNDDKETSWLDQLRGEGKEITGKEVASESVPLQPENEFGQFDGSGVDAEERLSAFADQEPELTSQTAPFIDSDEPDAELPISETTLPFDNGLEEHPGEGVDIPDWLSGLMASENASQEEPPQTSDQIPSWLNDEAETADQGNQDAEEVMPDWLGQAENLEQPQEKNIGEEDVNLPEWLMDIGADAEPLTPGTQEPETESETDIIPESESDSEENAFSGGLAALMAAAVQIDPMDKAEPEPVSELPEEPEELVDLSRSEEAKEDWLKILENELAQMDKAEQGEQPGEDTPQHPDETVFIGSDSPEFSTLDVPLSEEDQVSGPFIEDKDVIKDEPISAPTTPFMGEDIPEWLGEEDFTLTDEPEDQSAAPAGEPELARGDMPGWLKALRPVEAVTPRKPIEEKTHKIESVGPLAGLQGILPAENMALRYRKLPIYSTRLKASEKQREHAVLFEEVIAAENQPYAGRRERASAPRTFIRLLLGLLLIAVLVGTLMVAPGSTAGTVNVPEGAALFHNSLESISMDGPVLVAVEYSPGYTGEMRYAASAVLRRLLDRGAKLALISTVSTGPVQGEDLLQQAANLEGSTVSLADQSVNMGYLPAGITSLQQFALRPQQAVRYGLASALDGEPVWTSPVLSGVDSLDDFRLVLVITDSVDSGRAWVEQVEPALNGAPLLMVSSAQAAPMLEPYLQSGQVDGIVAGVSGGIAYEQLSQISGGARAIRGTYQTGMFVGVVILLLGLALGIITAVFSRSNGRREA